MQITEIVVSVHEKRNNPYAYGHYDAEVRLTAEVTENEDPDGAILRLRAIARQHVKNECNVWEAALRDEHARLPYGENDDDDELDH